MTATGRLTASKVTPGTRILVSRESAEWAALMERDAMLVPARTLTGDDVQTVLVTDTSSALTEPVAGERRRSRIYTLATSAGPVVLSPHQTVRVAPETPAAIKRAHVAALAENVERNRAVTAERRADALAIAQAETQAKADSRRVGQVVTLTDLSDDQDVTGVITKVVHPLTLGDVAVFQVTTLTGTRYAREASELAPADLLTAAEFARDVKILAPHHADLADADAALAHVEIPAETLLASDLWTKIWPGAVPAATIDRLAAEQIARSAQAKVEHDQASADQADRWEARHRAMGTPRRNAYPAIDYREADHQEALDMDARRLPAGDAPECSCGLSAVDGLFQDHASGCAWERWITQRERATFWRSWDLLDAEARGSVLGRSAWRMAGAGYWATASAEVRAALNQAADRADAVGGIPPWLAAKVAN